MIGEIRKIITQYYDASTNSMKFKSRPALIIAKADHDDYIVLPISTISRKENISTKYDIKIDPLIYTHSNLRSISYVRTHKQTVAHSSQISDSICDLKNTYEDLYLDILAKREQFSDEISIQAIC